MINLISVWILSMIALSWAVEDSLFISGFEKKAPMLGCHKRVFTYRISQADSKGRECWDHVSVWSCHGRCDSNEISDWRFPYKRSHHPVCMHAGRTRSVATLRHCHPEADAEAKLYEYMEPKSCSCQTCTSMDTSCEGPKQLSTDAATKIFQIDDEEIESEYA
ncbi:AAEL001474-PA [Aedes aegypti]|uniref:AAEL001474-PA n=2 Tax=Aedes aegypti TaxID=7159 RepID=A0A1S4EYZ9_AEDAE|nr:thyrostimulin beta-5 subunit [Aedes aegypti]EAT47389.1 AAEL001474-PA [Aedes aegypti]CAR95346.1 TPA: putative glycoprotein hormone-beta5 [Aedes aegypti]